MATGTTGTTIAEANRRRITDYLISGSKGPLIRKTVGVEIEHFVVDAKTSRAVPYEDENGRPGVRSLLEVLAGVYPERIETSREDLVGCRAGGTSITIEPSAQLEISIAPHEDIASVAREYRIFREYLEPYLSADGYTLTTLGYHPKEKAADLELIPKERYRLMDEYFAEIGSLGYRMMRATASTQVSIDFADEQDGIRKLRIAFALSPLLAYLTDNMPVYEGKANRSRLIRFLLWRNVDRRRCGCIPGVFDQGFSFSRYTDWMLSTTPIFVKYQPEGRAEPQIRDVRYISAGETYADTPLTEADIGHLISMYWPDVRLKRFIEIRPADSLPEAAMLGYVALIKGIFYSEHALKSIETLLDVSDGSWPLDDLSTIVAAAHIAGKDDSASVLGHPISIWKTVLFEEARQGLDSTEATYLEGLRTFQRKTGAAIT